jgi:hypothetical protein
MRWGRTERIRRISALVIALSLALPQRSCVNDGQLEIHYPLSNADSVWSIVLITAFFVLPLILQLIVRFRMTSLVAGIAVTGAGLYWISYGATIAASNLMIGWYMYTAGAVTYLLASLLQLQRAFRSLSFAKKPKF